LPPNSSDPIATAALTLPWQRRKSFFLNGLPQKDDLKEADEEGQHPQQSFGVKWVVGWT